MIQSIMVGVSFQNKRAHFKVSAKKQVKGAGKEKRKGGQREKDRDRKTDRQTERYDPRRENKPGSTIGEHV